MDNKLKLDLLRTMLEIRKAELQLAILYKHGEVPCAAHLYEGEEAIAAGVCANLNDKDCITSTHRGHGHCIAKGMDVKKMIAEVCARKTGCCSGKGGTMHMFAPEKGVMGTIGIVGGGMPIATGIGLALKMQKTNNVAVSFFGEGASNNGTFHESLNLASLWKLPVIYVCENNGFATSVSAKRSTSVKDISVRAIGYNMPGVTVDGNKVDEVYEAAKEAVERARAGEGPTLIECKTYRLRGHFEGDDCLYRTKEETEIAKQLRNPETYWKNCLIIEGVLTEEEYQQMEAEVDAKIAEAVEFALNSPKPEGEDAMTLYHTPLF